MDDLFRRFFGIPRYGNENPFKSPIWDEYEDEDELDLDIDLGVGPGNQDGPGFSFRVFTGDPLEMQKHFQSQIDEVMRSFMGFLGPMDRGFPEFRGVPSIEEAHPDHQGPALEDHPRNRYLKPSYENSSPRGRTDSDLDGRITGSEIDQLFENTEPVARPRRNFVFGGHSSTETWQSAPGGRVESRKIVRSSDGTEQTIITRRFGEQTHSVTVKKNKDGTTEQMEDFINMDEGDLSKFNELWGRKGNQILSVPPTNSDPPVADGTWADKFLKWFK